MLTYVEMTKPEIQSTIFASHQSITQSDSHLLKSSTSKTVISCCCEYYG